MVNYFVRNHNSKSQKYPETVETWNTLKTQILLLDAKVQYYGSQQIQCDIVEDEIIKEMEKAIERYK